MFGKNPLIFHFAKGAMECSVHSIQNTEVSLTFEPSIFTLTSTQNEDGKYVHV
jgi:hypothetical protein